MAIKLYSVGTPNKETIKRLRLFSKMFHIPYIIMVNVIYADEKKYWKTQKECCDALAEELSEGAMQLGY